MRAAKPRRYPLRLTPRERTAIRAVFSNCRANHRSPDRHLPKDAADQFLRQIHGLLEIAASHAETERIQRDEVSAKARRKWTKTCDDTGQQIEDAGRRLVANLPEEIPSAPDLLRRLRWAISNLQQWYRGCREIFIGGRPGRPGSDPWRKALMLRVAIFWREKGWKGATTEASAFGQVMKYLLDLPATRQGIGNAYGRVSPKALRVALKEADERMSVVVVVGQPGQPAGPDPFADELKAVPSTQGRHSSGKSRVARKPRRSPG